MRSLLFENQEEVLFLVDLWGGTPFNQASALLDGHEDKWAIVTGLNLPMLIETYASRFSMEKAHEIAAHVMQTAQEGVQINPKELEPKEEKKAEVSAALKELFQKEQFLEMDILNMV